ncbi:MAG: LacI family DNA-binding transcriptional regulator [Candidatus Sumerlaeota bacterium]
MVRLKDIAEVAGVSIGTVSKVLNGSQGQQYFGEDCIKRIRDAARKLGYVPNYHARSLQTGRARALGLVLSSSGLHQEGWEHFWALMMRGIFDHARELGYHVVSVTSTESDPHDSIDVGLQFLRESRIDALIVPPFDEVLNRHFNFPSDLGPIILIDQPQADMPGVELNGSIGIRKAVEHLASLGHKAIAWARPPAAYNWTVEPRQKAFHEAAAELGLESRDVEVGFRLGREKESLGERIAMARRTFLESRRSLDAVTAVVCYEESIALGLYAAAAQLGKSIPEDLSVVGFDDIFASIAWPPMTVVSHMLPELGKVAVEMAVARIENAGESERLRHIGAELVVRASTAAAQG